MRQTAILPLTSGFVGEFLLIKSVFQYHAWIGAAAGLTIILGAVYMLRSYQGAMSGETVAVTRNFTDLRNGEKLVLYPIVILVILIGVYPSPLMKISEASVANLVNDLSTFTATLVSR